MDEKRSYILECIRKIQINSKVIAKQKGPEYIASLMPDRIRRRYWIGTSFETLFFGPTMSNQFWRLRNGYIHFKI